MHTWGVGTTCVTPNVGPPDWNSEAAHCIQCPVVRLQSLAKAEVPRISGVSLCVFLCVWLLAVSNWASTSTPRSLPSLTNLPASFRCLFRPTLHCCKTPIVFPWLPFNLPDDLPLQYDQLWADTLPHNFGYLIHPCCWHTCSSCLSSGCYPGHFAKGGL